MNRVFRLAAVASLALGLSFGARGALGPEGRPGNQTAAQRNAAAVGGPVVVTDAEGTPLEGVALLVQSRPVVLLPDKISETSIGVTDKSGTLRQPPAEVPGVHFLLVKDGHETLALDAARPLPGRLTLPPGRRLTGKIFSPDGQPIAGAVVGPVTEAPSGPASGPRGLQLRRAVRTGPDGSFALDGLPKRPVQVQVAAPGYRARLVDLPVGEQELKVQLSSGGAIIKGKVVGSKDRAPHGQIPVEATGNGITVYTVTDKDGLYLLDNLATGTWHVRPASGGPVSGTQSRAVVADLTSADQLLDLPLVLNQGVMLAGRAVDAETSRGIAGMNITLAGYAGRGDKAVLTQPDGSFLFENLDSMQDVIIRFDPVQFVYVLPEGAYRDYFDISQVSDTDFDVTTLTLPLFRRLPVQGEVVASDGNPAPDVEVHLQALDVVASAPTKSGVNLLSFFTKSNGEGRFKAGVYPPGRYKVWAQETAFVSQVEQVDIFSTAPMPQLKLKLDQAAELEGVVVDAHDRPVTAAVVIAWPANAPEPEENPIPGRETYAYAKSGKEGRFKLEGLRGEPLMLRADHPDFFQSVRMNFDPKSPAGSAPGTTRSVTMKFPAGGEFSVIVTDDAGRPLSQAEVAVEYREGLEGHRAAVITDRFGQAAGAALPVRQLERVTVSHPMFASFTQEGPIPLPVHGINIALKKRASLVANVTGENLFPNVVPTIYLMKAPAGGEHPPADEAFEHADQADVMAGQVLFRSLPEGWYKVVFAESGAYAESKSVKIVSGSEDQTVDLALPKGNHLVGLITDKQSEQAIAGANVTVRPAVQSSIVTERATQNTTTQQDGSFELYNVAAGSLQVRVVVAGYPDYEKTVNFTADDDVLHIELSNAPASLSGVVTVGGAPVEGALLILSTRESEGTPVATALTGEDGTYTMDDFTAGIYTLSVEAPIGDGDNISRKSLSVELEGGETTRNVEFAGLVQVSGQVRLDGKAPTRAGGEPITLMFRPKISEMGSIMVNLEANGTYSAQMEPGEYEAGLEDRPGVPVTISPGSSQKLDLNF